MAKVIPTAPHANYETGSTKPASKSRHKSKFTAAQDFIIAQEVSADEAHLAPHGEILSRFNTEVNKASKTRTLGTCPQLKTYEFVLRSYCMT